jgi:hypothetical protein
MLAITGLPIAVAVAGARIAISAACYGAAAQNPIANAPGLSPGGGLAVSYWKVIMSVRLNVVAFGFKGWFAKFALPEFKTL